MQFSDADSGGQARAKLFMAPNKVRLQGRQQKQKSNQSN